MSRFHLQMVTGGWQNLGGARTRERILQPKFLPAAQAVHTMCVRTGASSRAKCCVVDVHMKIHFLLNGGWFSGHGFFIQKSGWALVQKEEA